MSLPTVDILDELFSEATAGVLPGTAKVAPLPVQAPQPIKKVNYSHEAMIDAILANPGVSQNVLAAMFGYTPSWVSQVISSDAFQAAFAKRKSEVVDPTLLLTVQENFDAIVRRSQDILLEKLAAPASVVPDQLVIQSLATAARARGYGAREPVVVATQTTVSVDVHLNALGERLTGLLRKKKSEVVDAEVEEIAGTSAEQ